MTRSFPSLTPKHVINALKRGGFYVHHVKGSHCTNGRIRLVSQSLLSQVLNLGVRLRAARRFGVVRTGVRLLRKTGVLDTRALRRWDLLHDDGVSRPQRMRTFLQYYEARASESGSWAPLDFEGKRVLEIGCGPLGGWGPLAIERGAADYVGVDPGMDPDLLGDPALVRGYLRAVFADLRAGDGTDADFEVFRKQFADRARYAAASIQNLDTSERFDLVLSNSCLEHINGFDDFAAHLARRMATGARMLHLVNFSNHRDKASPFSSIYEMPPDVYHKRFGRHINLLRAREMGAAFEHCGLAIQWIPLDVQTDALSRLSVDPWWTARYDTDTLALRTALLVDSGSTR